MLNIDRQMYQSAIARLKTVVASLRRDERGLALVEMAMIAPILGTVLVGMVDLSNGYSKKLQLEQAAQRTVQKAERSLLSPSMTEQLQAEGALAANVPKDQVAVDFWLECDATRVADYDGGCPAGQIYARFLSVRITSSYKPIFSTHFGSTTDGAYILTGKAQVRTQ